MENPSRSVLINTLLQSCDDVLAILSDWWTWFHQSFCMLILPLHGWTRTNNQSLAMLVNQSLLDCSSTLSSSSFKDDRTSWTSHMFWWIVSEILDTYIFGKFDVSPGSQKIRFSLCHLFKECSSCYRQRLQIHGDWKQCNRCTFHQQELEGETGKNTFRKKSLMLKPHSVAALLLFK